MIHPAERSREITCACACGTEFAATLYTTANITLEPTLLYRLLSGTLNVMTCPNCGRKAAIAQPFFYHDMARGLFAYVHPEDDPPEETRAAVLEQLQRAYTLAVEESERQVPTRGAADVPVQLQVRRRTPGDDLSAQIEPEVPPLQLIFGVDRLIALVESLLEPGERLRRAALSTRSAAAAERERLLVIARQVAEQVGGILETEESAEGLVVWVYGPRDRVALLARALEQRPT